MVLYKMLVGDNLYRFIGLFDLRFRISFICYTMAYFYEMILDNIFVMLGHVEIVIQNFFANYKLHFLLRTN